MKRILWQDVVIVLAFVLYLGAGVATKMIIAEVSLYTELAEQLESNPIARQTLDMRYAFTVLQWLAIAYFASTYYLSRRRYRRDPTEVNKLLLSTFTIGLTCLFLQNFMNDAGVLLGLFLN